MVEMKVDQLEYKLAANWDKQRAHSTVDWMERKMVERMVVTKVALMAVRTGQQTVLKSVV